MTTQTLYKVIGFGNNEHGFFNQLSCSSSIGYACGFYNAHLQDPEMDGAVIIKCVRETWEVIQEFNSQSYPYSIECTALFSHRITKSPELVMV